MSQKQLKKLIIAIVAMVVVVGGVVAALFLVDTDSLGETDIESVKAEGGYEILKSDISGAMTLRDSQAATISNILFETIGIKKYESMEPVGRRGNVTIYVDDGYKLDCFIKGGEIANAYIGNVLIYKNPKVTSITVANALEYTYGQYKSLVESFSKAVDVDLIYGKDMYEQLSMMNINSFTSVDKGKLNGIKGYYGYEGLMKYFMVIENNAIKSIQVVCDAFEPMEVYNSSNPKPAYNLSDIKVLMGGRQGIASVMGFRINQATGLEVTLPPALLSGDDSWLMVRQGDEIYLECDGEVKVKDKEETKHFYIRIVEDTRDITYLKIDKKVYVGAE